MSFAIITITESAEDKNALYRVDDTPFVIVRNDDRWFVWADWDRLEEAAPFGYFSDAYQWVKDWMTRVTQQVVYFS
jgi:hypothetical protein